MPSVYEKYQLKPVINASGRMTILGVSTPEQEVVDAVNFGLGHYFEVKDLVNKTGAYLAGLLDVEDAVLVSCASAGIAQSVAAMIVRGDPYRLEQLHARLAALAGQGAGEAMDGEFSARQRHVEAIAQAQQHLEDAAAELQHDVLELAAEQLRLAHDALGEITGRMTADDLLGKIFSSFCIGK